MEAVDSSSKQYSLRWEKHAFNLATEAGYFFEDESFLDCTLSAEGQCIEAHKIILSASSSYLSSLLKITPDKHPILIFNDIKFEQLKSLVAFIYNGSVNVSENNIHDFLNAAQSLLIKGLYEDESQEKTSENLKRIHLQDPKTHPRHILPKNPQVIRKPEQNSEPFKILKKQRASVLGKRFPDCEENLSKLQEISFTKYINQNLGCDGAEPKWNGPGEEKSVKSPENYVVKSWKHNSVDDLNARHKTGGRTISEDPKIFKNFQFKKFKLEKPREEPEVKTKLPPEKTEPEKANSEDLEDNIKKEPEIEQIMLVEPKQEMMEEDDTNSEYDNGQTTGSETLTSEPETVYDGRSVPGYFQHPIVDRGIPVPLLMCKTSLSEPDSSEGNWIPSGTIISEHPPHQLASIDNSQDLQCRTCSQDLPCPTCTKKYKSRYALNRHILYECGKARKSFSCDECGKKVTRQDTLQKHKLIHLVQHLKEQESEGDKPDSVKPKKK